MAPGPLTWNIYHSLYNACYAHFYEWFLDSHNLRIKKSFPTDFFMYKTRPWLKISGKTKSLGVFFLSRREATFDEENLFDICLIFL